MILLISRNEILNFNLKSVNLSVTPFLLAVLNNCYFNKYMIAWATERVILYIIFYQ